MPITKVGTSLSQVTTNGTTRSVTRTAGAVGNLLVVAGIQAIRTNAGSVSDTQGNTWIPVNPDLNDATNTSRMASWYALAKNTSSTVITFASNSGTGFMSITMDEFTGNDTTSPLDQVNHTTIGASGSNPITPAITLGAADCLVWSYIASGSNPAPANIDGSTATQGADDGSFEETEYRILSGRNGASITAAWTMSTNAYDVFIASFKPAVSGSVGSSTGTSTATAIGSATTQGVGSSAGTSTATAIGSSLAQSVGASAGVATVTGIAFSGGQGVGSSDGTSTAIAIGASLAAGAGSSAGTSTATATSTSQDTGAGSSTGTSTATAIGRASTTGAGSSAGISTVAAIGSSQAKSVGSATGTSTALAFAQGSSIGVSAGTSTALAIGSASTRGIGSSIGSSTATATAQSVAQAVGSAAGTSTANAVKGTPNSAGVAAGTSTALAIGASQARSIGSALGFSTASGVAGNPALTFGTALAASIDLAETFDQHFTSRGWSSYQDQADAGYPLVAEPVPLIGHYTERIDYGLTLSNLIVTVTYNQTQISGSTIITVEMQVSTDDITYSSYTAGSTQFFQTFRYLRFKLTFTGANDKSIITITNLTIRLDVKREQDGGIVTALSTDVSGTPVTFNKAYKDIDAITATPMGTVERKAIVDFADVPNPTGFSVYLFSAAGARVTGDVRWIARGVV